MGKVQAIRSAKRRLESSYAHALQVTNPIFETYREEVQSRLYAETRNSNRFKRPYKWRNT